MVLDRLKLTNYFEGDTSLEQEFLLLMVANVRTCVDALTKALDAEAPSTQWDGLYRVLHSAKPGVMMAANDATSAEMVEMCEALASGQFHRYSALANGLRNHLAELASELQQESMSGRS
jgi:hypothetical protein